MFIRAENITHTYMPGTPFAVDALKGVSLSIERGTVAAIIGPSGSGKSTLVQHLNGLLTPAAGRLVIDGKAVGSTRDELLRLRRRIGLVFQSPENQFFAETVFDEIAFAPRNLGLAPSVVEARVEQVMELIGLDHTDFGDRSPFLLSAGEKRLVAIASVLSMQPEVLILDEPGAGLDQFGQQNLFALLQRLNERDGMTIVVVTHRLEQVAALVREYFVLSEGRLAVSGSPGEVFSRGEELRNLGLALPPVTALMHDLAAAGLPVRTAIFSLEEARREIMRCLRQVEQQ